MPKEPSEMQKFPLLAPSFGKEQIFAQGKKAFGHAENAQRRPKNGNKNF
jgi:hypothetical protein